MVHSALQQSGTSHLERTLRLPLDFAQGTRPRHAQVVERSRNDLYQGTHSSLSGAETTSTRVCTGR